MIRNCVSKEITMKHSISELLRYISARNIRNCVFHFKQNSRPIYCLVRPSVWPTSHLTLTARSRHPQQTCTHLVMTHCNGDSQRRTSELHVAPSVCRNIAAASAVLKTTAFCQSLITHTAECTA